MLENFSIQIWPLISQKRRSWRLLPFTYQFLNRQVSRPCTFDLMLDSASLGVVWMIFANFDIRSTGSFCAIPGFMSVPPQNGHIFSKHCIYGNFHPRGLKFWPVRDFLQGQKIYFLIHGQKMPFSCGFFHFCEILSFKKAFTKNPISPVFFELQTSNFGKWEIYMWVKKNILWLWAKKCNLHVDFFIFVKFYGF